ncbi:unnamed protein product, partial [marine sediment metagenome]
MENQNLRLFFVLLSSVFFLFAGEYGRITGKVVDKETGEPLIGVEVTVNEINLTVTTDENGEYIIPYIKAAKYSLSMYFLAYELTNYIDVVVNTGHTTILNTQMSPKHPIDDYYGYVLRAKRPLIDFSQTSSSQIITSEEIERLPVTTIDEIIKLQPEIIESDFGLHLRGGGYDEITYYLNGITIMSPYYTGWQHARINPLA